MTQAKRSDIEKVARAIAQSCGDEPDVHWHEWEPQAHAAITALHCASSPTPEQVARMLARFDWPCAPKHEREAWVEKHWREHLPKAEAVLALITGERGNP